MKSLSSQYELASGSSVRYDFQDTLEGSTMPDIDWSDLRKDHVDEIRQFEQERLSVPDHVKSARVNCAREFIDRVLLPQLAQVIQLGKHELVRLLSEFKAECYKQHPHDLGEAFSLMQSVDRQICLRVLQEMSQPSEDTEILNQAADFIAQMLDDYPEDLYPI
jgi:hypothetical protein